MQDKEYLFINTYPSWRAVWFLGEAGEPTNTLAAFDRSSHGYSAEESDNSDEGLHLDNANIRGEFTWWQWVESS
jgi:hypothetical protein